MPHSVVTLDVHDSSIDATIELPSDDLRLASGIDITAADALENSADALSDYIAAHLQITTPSGEPWTVDVGELTIADAEQTSTGQFSELVAQIEMTPPADATTREFTLDDTVIIHQVITHRIFVVVDQDWAGGDLGDEAKQLGVIAVDPASGTVAPLTIDLGSGSMWSGFVAMVQLGGTHILEGTDHLLFLIVLLLPAPLIAFAGRWRRPAGPKRSVLRIVSITLAFTIGHSATLAISALTHLDIPAVPIESLIAVSILVGALHAIRPLFPGKEAVVAGLFGLIHGMAFSFTLAELGLSTGQLVISLLGFNIGIELLQLAVVAAVLPAFVILSPWRGYAVLRVGLALVAGTSALGWLLARLGVNNPIADVADGLGAYGGWAIVALWVVTIGYLVERRHGRRHAFVGEASEEREESGAPLHVDSL
ncbi:HupE/UreJ family protein [Microbacterium sp. RG1]|uniref:HupE/UreJ family protein n=1 Tax=Microbacterium sp. RG1 TaxID=2489212 RepID=UPI00137546BD|nr:HupE/UreJ family protein [Microbacterium sp. RG1]